MERKRGMGGGGVRESEREEESESEGFRERASERMCWLTLSLFWESDKERACMGVGGKGGRLQG